ncbi:MAG: hypothetical protein ABIF77_08405, partial [bacterium]
MRYGAIQVRWLLFTPILLLTIPLAMMIGCGTDQLGVVPVIPNEAPDTQVSGEAPFLLEAGFLIKLSWSGSDLDGEVAGYEWRLAKCGPEGHSPGNLKTFDPATGDDSDEWHFTAEPCTTLVISAPHPDEITGPELNFTVFVRAVDSEGEVDPTPARLSFTASTLLPSIFVDRPASLWGQNDSQALPPSQLFGFTGVDPDFEPSIPTKFRYIFKYAWVDDHYVRTRYEFEQVKDELVSFADSAWSEWMPYPADPEERTVTFPNQQQYDDENRLIHYLFAIQTMDTTGAVSIDREYGRNVVNTYVDVTMTPVLTIHEFYLGT